MTRKTHSKKVPATPRRHKGKRSRPLATNRQGRSPARERDQKLRHIEDEIISFIFSRGGEASRKDIVAGLQLPIRGRRKDIEQTLKAMCLDKTLSCKGDMFRDHNSKDLIEATISANPRGFAFARPTSETTDSRDNDIFIPPGANGSANHGDRVLVRLARARRDKQEGRVIRVLSRATSKVVGTYQDNGLIIPEDDRLTYQVRVAAGQAGNAKKGDVVVAELLDFSSTGQPPTGRIIKVLGSSDDPSVQADIVIYIHDLPHEFSAETLAQVEKLDGTIKVEAGRADLRNIHHVTIDGETARDFDDAVAIEKINKNFRLYVSIADVSHYVRPGTPLDQEAYQRGTSVYFPGRVVPMLPERLSNDLCSLVPDQDRLAFTAILDLSPQGKLLKRKFTRSVIRSHQRFTYTIVHEILSAEPQAEIRKTYLPFVDDLETMARLAKVLGQNRTQRGSIGFEIPEPEINLDAEGRIDNISRSQRNQAHKMIEEFMLAANEAVAGAFSELEDPARFDFLYRIHERPDPLKVEDFVAFAKTLGISLDGTPDEPRWFAAVIEAVKGTPKEYIISNLLLRTMQQARYSPDNAGHFGLAATDYCHFTSPIRRYPDLMVHRALQQLISGDGKRGGHSEATYSSAEEAGIFLSGRERVAVAADREMVERLQVRYMADKIGEVFPGIVSGVASFGIFIELLESFISGAIQITDLTGDYFEIDEKNHRVLGKTSGRIIQIGDQIQVRVSEVNIQRRRINFTLAED